MLVAILLFGCDSSGQTESKATTPDQEATNEAIAIEGKSEYPMDSIELLKYSQMLLMEEIRSRNLEGLTIDSTTIEKTENPDCLYSVSATLSNGQKVVICWDLYVQSHLRW
ncbi:hypothetical protein G0Q06_13110 [Puniceicoccales bacterium CK1056]|uniref:Uncharacterized protein n=1 Tax=Oceanipulchritudo coccoides TaxID=2706888 RepID=A0A6B2M359_9BACT|nr:hypothetical protein [Oceanipulchritudo coccoides]